METILAASGWTAIIDNDVFCADPREDDNLGVLLCWHRRYALGDRNPYPAPDGFYEDRVLQQSLCVMLPVYLMDHSGLSITTDCSLFRAVDPVRWDWGQLGVIYATRKAVCETFGVKRISEKRRKQAGEVLIQEVKTYNSWQRGDTWVVEIQDRSGVRQEVCGGFIGIDAAREEARRMLEEYAEGKVTA